MLDQYGRNIDYLRISVTDRCNLRCVYCMPEEGIDSLPHSEILTYEEILRVVGAALPLGIENIKITGGEPLVRKNIVELIRRIKDLEGIKTVTMTTNGLRFGELGDELVKAGLDGVNFSLDCLHASTYCQMTRADAFDSVQKSIQLALNLGLRTKINCVPMREYNSEELVSLAGLAKRYPLAVRFIELMPIGRGKQFTPIENEDILRQLIRAYGEPQRSFVSCGNGPAVYYDFPGFLGGVGLISALSQAFCQTCNRVRLSADGILKPCLCYKQGTALKPLLRDGTGPERLQQVIKETIFGKPRRHDLGGLADATMESKNMVQIGG